MADKQITTLQRVHIALPVSDLAQSAAFYQRLFGEPPVKQKPEFVKFAPTQVPINLSLNLREIAPTITISPAHFGVEVQTVAELDAFRQRLQAHEVATIEEPGVSCCYAKQSKLWLSDPNQNNWEIYLIEEAEVPDYNCDCGSTNVETGTKPKTESKCQC